MHVSEEYAFEREQPLLEQPCPAAPGPALSLVPPERPGRLASHGQVRTLLDMVAAAELLPADSDQLDHGERALVDEAVAVLVEENGLVAGEAFDVLRLLAGTDQQNLADVAQAVVADATRRERSAARSTD